MKNYVLPRNKLIIIWWTDSSGPPPGWVLVNDELNEKEALQCISVGFVIKETKDYILIGPHIGLDLENNITQFNSSITIPKCSIKKIRRIKL